MELFRRNPADPQTRVKRAMHMVIVTAVVGVLSLVSQPAFAQSEPTPTWLAFSSWAQPLNPDATLDPYDPNLADNVQSVMMFMVIEFAAPLTQSDFESVTERMLQSGEFTDAAPARDTPDLLSDSTGYIYAESGVSMYLFLSYEQDHFFILISYVPGEGDVGEATLNRVARTYLTAIPGSSPPGLTEVVLASFGEMDGYSVDQPLGYLPSRTDIPSEYQFLDEEFLAFEKNP